MKRVLTKIAGILDTVLYGLLAAGCSLLFGLILSGSALLSQIVGVNIHRIFMAVLVFVIFIIAVVGLVFSIKAISFSRDSIEVYRNKYPMLITNVVFNSMFAVMFLLFIGSPNLFDVSVFACFIACGMLYVIDMTKNSQLLIKKEISINEDDEGSLENNVNANDLEVQLKKLMDLKEQNLITEKELISLREKLVKKEIEKE